MSIDPSEYAAEEGFRELFESELQRLSEEPVFDYLARHGDAIETRVRGCASQARELLDAGFHGAALVRATAGLEIAIRFFLVRPLLHGAFLSEDWARALSERILRGRAAEDRTLLPAILSNWRLDITSVRLAGGAQAWESIVGIVWPRRNDYVHKGSDCGVQDAELALECLDTLLARVVDPIGARLGFTRERTGRWCEVHPSGPSDPPGLNMPHTYPVADPFVS